METAIQANIAILKMQIQKNISYHSTYVEHQSWPTRNGNSKDDFYNPINTNTHVVDCSDQNLHSEMLDCDYTQGDDLADYVRKRTCRFFVDGFKPSITEQKIANYVNFRGPKVTKVSIFRYRSKPVVTRLNVEDDVSARLVCEPYFWPDGVVCRPWVSQSKYDARDFDKVRNGRSQGKGDHLYYDIERYNGYQPEVHNRFNGLDTYDQYEY